MKTPKFTKAERAKLQVVFDKLRAELDAALAASGERYDSHVDGCCGNCGDTGPHFSMLYRLEKEFGMRK